MQHDNGTILGIFSDITDAKRATDELHSKGIAAARLVENELALTFTGTAERDSHRGGVRGFFARLFGLSDEREDWKLSSDSESYFRNAYDKKHHLVVIEGCKDMNLARAIIAQRGGFAEEQGSQYFHSERHSQRKASLTARATADQATESGLGVDVDRMPFAHSIPIEKPEHQALAASARDDFDDEDHILPPGSFPLSRPPGSIPPGP